ncbi:putative pantothenate transporter protein [Phaeoacremonium minimum UCRPA7]|uniref:Putative pantothenate transporter protein n=1 Tax=Phaeoacremonium minimum (strain UCR-PA7) TaxID=1286976 RepID=R8BSE7_PHAM7|nr:putative pantothenate transporter protein [Phaeoacremonium minimum UCRPA7]EOO02303.1 putative pantothenate transporter protein [Phaeoacremonium minimum UCRPA7]
MEKTTERPAIESVAEGVMDDVDKAYQFAKEHHVEPLTEAENKRILRKIDFHLLPLMVITYTLNFMDKNALSYSANFGLIDDNVRVFICWAVAYSIPNSALSTYTVTTYMVSQPFVARLIVRFPVGRFVACATVLWGAVLMTMPASRSFASLMTIRAILGCLESCINPAFIVISSQWWTREEQPLRITFWYLGNSIGQVCGGLLGYGIAHINSPTVPNWAWFFIIFGAITVVYGSFLFFYLPDSPMNARWLSDHDRALAIERVRSNRTGVENHVWKWSQFKECVTDIQCWILVATFFLDDIPAGGVASFGSIVVKGFGFSTLYSTLLLVPLGVIQAICILFGGFMTRKFKNIRTWLIAGTYYPTHAENNFAGYTKKATAGAMMYVAFCVGQVVAPQLFLAKEAPVYETAFRASFICFALCIVFTIALRYYLIWENKRRERMALAETETAGSNDEFLDMTDKQQKLIFRYVM